MSAVRWLLALALLALLVTAAIIFQSLSIGADTGTGLICCFSYSVFGLVCVVLFLRAIAKEDKTDVADVDVGRDGSDDDYIQSLRHSD